MGRAAAHRSPRPVAAARGLGARPSNTEIRRALAMSAASAMIAAELKRKVPHPFSGGVMPNSHDLRSSPGADNKECNQFWLDLQDFLQIVHKRYVDRGNRPSARALQNIAHTFFWRPQPSRTRRRARNGRSGKSLRQGVSRQGHRFFQRVVLANMSVDRVEAYKWFSLALQGGHTAVARDLWLLKRVMSDDQLKAAERKIEEYARERQGVREFTN